ncbi:hypothetical protein HDV04_005851 [Boothiomyces sp. JEL0838]|nr:hypothetical protein HDV04_005851 [Boothiomyces sp. JEL0838]
MVSYNAISKSSKITTTYHWRILALAAFTVLKAFAGIIYVLSKSMKLIQGTAGTLSSYNIFVFMDIAQQWWVLYEILYRAQSMIPPIKKYFWWIFVPLSLTFILKFARMFAYTTAYLANSGTISISTNQLIQTYFINLPTCIIIVSELILEGWFFYCLINRVKWTGPSTTETTKYLLTCAGCEFILLLVYLVDSFYVMATSKPEYLSYFSHLCYGYMIADLLEFGGNLKDLLKKGESTKDVQSIKATDLVSE